jgi:hypothetical protein
MKKLKPEMKPHIGCLCCGGAEMKIGEKEITASMKTRIYGGFGGWTITRNNECVFQPDCNGEWKSFPTLMKFENMARRSPKADWRAVLFLPLREAEYQRQGKNRWVLVRTGMGFA